LPFVRPPGTFSLEGFGLGPIYLSRPTHWASSLYDTRYCGVLFRVVKKNILKKNQFFAYPIFANGIF
jgi:hypothetical protein